MRSVFIFSKRLIQRSEVPLSTRWYATAETIWHDPSSNALSAPAISTNVA